MTDWAVIFACGVYAVTRRSYVIAALCFLCLVYLQLPRF